MNLKSLSDQALLAATAKLAHEERELLIAVLAHLREIERRRLFCDLGFSSLHAYAVKHLKYSDDQAARRINAMRLIKDLPDVAEKVQSGKLSLSNASSAQTFSKRTAMSPEKKRELVKKLEDKSTREAEREMAAISPQAVRKDSVRSVSEKTVEIRFSAPRELEAKLSHLRGILAHKFPHLTLAELVEKLADLGLSEWNPAKTVRPIKTRAGLLHSTEGASNQEATEGASTRKVAAETAAQTGTISNSTRREVWRRDRGECVNCGSQHAVEVDHCLPRSHGGAGTIENLRLLCRKCNQRAAIKILGLKKMEQHLQAQHQRTCSK